MKSPQAAVQLRARLSKAQKVSPSVPQLGKPRHTRTRTRSASQAAHFVSQQQARHRVPVWQRQLAVQILLPLLAVAEGADVGDVEHDDAGGRLPVVQPRH